MSQEDPKPYQCVRSTALTRGFCVLCDELYERGEAIVSSWRRDGSDLVEERWHLLCWEAYQATGALPPKLE